MQRGLTWKDKPRAKGWIFRSSLFPSLPAQQGPREFTSELGLLVWSLRGQQTGATRSGRAYCYFAPSCEPALASRAHWNEWDVAVGLRMPFPALQHRGCMWGTSASSTASFNNAQLLILDTGETLHTRTSYPSHTSLAGKASRAVARRTGCSCWQKVADAFRYRAFRVGPNAVQHPGSFKWHLRRYKRRTSLTRAGLR